MVHFDFNFRQAQVPKSYDFFLEFFGISFVEKRFLDFSNNELIRYMFSRSNPQRDVNSEKKKNKFV